MLRILGWILKIVGWILLIVLLVLLAAMCVPLHLTVKYEPEVTLRLRYFFYTFYILGEKPPKKPPGRFRRALAAVGKGLLTVIVTVWKAIAAVFRWIGKGFKWLASKLRRKPKPKKKKPAPAKKPEKKQGFIGSLVEQRGVFGMIGFFADIGRALGGGMARIYRGIRFDFLSLHASVAGEDAADTAVKYGQICSGAFPALSFLLSHSRGYDPASPRTKDIEIVPDFAGEGIKITLICELTVFPILVTGHLLGTVIRFAVSQIKYTWKHKGKKAASKES